MAKYKTNPKTGKTYEILTTKEKRDRYTEELKTGKDFMTGKSLTKEEKAFKEGFVKRR